MTFVIASTSLGLPEILGQQDELPLPLLIPVDTRRGISGFATMPLQKLYLIWIHGTECIYHWPSTGEFFFRVEPSSNILLLVLRCSLSNIRF